MIKRGIICCLLLCITYGMHAQEPKSVCQQLSQLKEGTLLIRLESNQKKITTMESLLEKTSQSSLKDKTQFDLKELKAATLKNNRNLIKYFKKNYQFSNLLFIYDADYKDLIKNKNYSNFLNEELQKGEASFDPNNTFLCRIGSTQVNEGTGAKSLVFADLEGNDMTKPFPNTIKYEGGLIEILFSGDREEEKRAIRLSTKLQKKLERYFERCSY